MTRVGIRFKGLEYTCTTAKEEHWNMKARHNGSWKISAFYDPRCVDSIFIRHTDGKMEQCFLLDKKKTFNRRSVYEVLNHNFHVTSSRHVRRSKDEQAAVDFNSTVESIIQNAQQEQQLHKDAAGKKSNAAKVRGIRPQRQHERQRERDAGAWYADSRQPGEQPGVAQNTVGVDTSSVEQGSQTSSQPVTPHKPLVNISMLRAIRDEQGD